MPTAATPLERIYNLGSLGRAGAEVVVTARRDELAQLARWAGVREVVSFEATVNLKRLSATRFSYDAELQARIGQDCVATLEPIDTNLCRNLHRQMYLAEPSARSGSDDVVIDPDSEVDDIREEITDLRYDLAKPLLEELVLAIDPYPRAPGAAFASPPEPDAARPNPFAILKNLKNRGNP